MVNIGVPITLVLGYGMSHLVQNIITNRSISTRAQLLIGSSLPLNTPSYRVARLPHNRGGIRLFIYDSRLNRFTLSGRPRAHALSLEGDTEGYRKLSGSQVF